MSVICSPRLSQLAPGLWRTLEYEPGKGKKKELIARRAASAERRQEREQQLRKRRSEAAHDDERKALRSQMAMEEAERRELEDVKEEEKTAAEEEVYRTLARVEAESSGLSRKRRTKRKQLLADGAAGGAVVEDVPAGGASDDDIDTDSDNGPPSAPPVYESEEARRRAEAAEKAAEAMLAEEAAEEAAAARQQRSDIFEDAQGNVDSGAREASDDDDVTDDDEDVVYVPPPRETVKATYTFTERVFPTPLRESKVREEDQWVEKNRAGLIARGRIKPKPVEGARDVSERDPVWLKGRGDDFFRAGDFRSAVNAYTAALEAEPSMLACLSNRAACHLKLHMLDECIADCRAALGHLPEPPALRDTGAGAAALDEEGRKRWEDAEEREHTMVVKLLLRRGTARCQSTDYAAALADFRLAASVRGDDDLLASDIARLEKLVVCATLKAEGDAAVREGQFATAIEKFSQALTVEPTFVSCFSNRAAANMAAGDFVACVADCTSALRLLAGADDIAAEAAAAATEAGGGAAEDTDGSAVSAPPSPAGPIPPPGSSKHREWVLKTLVRRGTAHLHTDNLDGAARDYQRAVALAPDNAALAKDLRRIERRLQQPARDEGTAPPLAEA